MERQPALEQHRLAELAGDLEQRVVLHVARADLHDVGVLGDRVGVRGVEQLGDDRQPGLRARLGEDLQRRGAQALERERRRARLERAAAQHRRAAGLAPRARPPSVCSRDSTVHGPAIRQNVSPPPTCAAADVEDVGLVVAELGGGQLVGPRDRHDAIDAGHALEAELAHALGIADRADRRRQLAGHHHDVHAGLAPAARAPPRPALGGARCHDDHHGRRSVRWSSRRAWRGLAREGRGGGCGSVLPGRFCPRLRSTSPHGQKRPHTGRFLGKDGSSGGRSGGWGELLACGLTASGIARWVAIGRLHRVFRGVYLVGHPVPAAARARARGTPDRRARRRAEPPHRRAPPRPPPQTQHQPAPEMPPPNRAPTARRPPRTPRDPRPQRPPPHEPRENAPRPRLPPRPGHARARDQRSGGPRPDPTTARRKTHEIPSRAQAPRPSRASRPPAHRHERQGRRLRGRRALRTPESRRRVRLLDVPRNAVRRRARPPQGRALRLAGYQVLRFTWGQITDRPESVAAAVAVALNG